MLWRNDSIFKGFLGEANVTFGQGLTSLVQRGPLDFECTLNAKHWFTDPDGNQVLAVTWSEVRATEGGRASLHISDPSG